MKVKRIVALVICLCFVFGNMGGVKSVNAASTISVVKLYLDTSFADLNTNWTEGEVENRFREYVGGLSAQAGFTEYDLANCWLTKLKSGTWYGTYDGSSYVDAGAEYYWVYALRVNPDYSLPSKIANLSIDSQVKCSEVSGFNVYFNEVDISNQPTYIQYRNGLLYILVKAAAPTTDGRATSITMISPMSLKASTSYDLICNVSGVNMSNTGVDYEVSGNVDSYTKITSAGKITIGTNETSKVIYVKATSKNNKSCYVKKAIKIRKGTSINSINVGLKVDKFDFNFKFSEQAISNMIKQYTSNQYYYTVNDYDTGLCYKDGESFVWAGDSVSKVDPGKEYYAKIAVFPISDFCWTNSIDDCDPEAFYRADLDKGVFFMVNSSEEGIYYSYEIYRDVVTLYVPIKFTPVDLVEDSDLFTIEGITDKEFTGSPITQSPVVKAEGYTFTQGKDFDVTYVDNTNVGKAKVTITGKATLSGSVTKEFNITEKKGGSGNNNNNNNNSDTPKNKLVTTEKGSQYYKEDGTIAKNEWATINNIKYYFNSDGYNASNEWRDGKWISSDGSCTYEGELSWECNSTGWWVEDSKGWYPVSSWQKIDGIWYYFNSSGYMASNEYYNGYWFNADGSWDDQYFLTWKSNSTGWWVEDKSGWWPSSKWLKIDGYWYYFDASGYMVTNQYIDGYWLGSDGACQ